MPLGEDKSKLSMPELPSTIDPSKRKMMLNMLMNWSTQPTVIKNFPLLILNIRAMASIMDPITGIYEKPEFPTHPGVLTAYKQQDLALASSLIAEVTNLEYTSLWNGSTSIGAGEHKVLYPIQESSGVSMIYAWISQYVLI